MMGQPVACGGLRQIDETHGEIKRMYVTDSARGTGAPVAALRGFESAGANAGGPDWCSRPAPNNMRRPLL